ncbi:MAG: methionine adenosyltransferase [Candidatus Thorarchaeota archaeon]
MTKKYLFSSESVSEGHPDKMADQISDAVLDALLRQDKNSRVACETFLTTGLALVGGEIHTNGYVEIRDIVQEVIRDIGYINPDYGFHPDVAILNAIHEQSADIAQGVVREKEEDQGAGDQGLIYGYATTESSDYMPITISLAHKLTKGLADARKSKKIPYLRPDGKSQVTVEFLDGKPQRIHTIVIAQQHNPEINPSSMNEDILEKIIEPICGQLLDKNTKILINGTGRFVIGGPHGDTGLTGRKIIVDSYGGGHHGGGAYSGKDPSKVDRSASYMARYIAKNVVAAGYAEKCEVQIAYCIGVAQPVSVFVDTYGTGKLTDEQILDKINKEVDLRPRAIIKKLDLLRPIYRKTTNYGHFGRNEPEFTWEKIDLF